MHFNPLICNGKETILVCRIDKNILKDTGLCWVEKTKAAAACLLSK